MQPDVTELMEFYERPLGAVVRRILAHQIRVRWPHLKGSTLVGLGFTTPYMGSFRGEADRVMACMSILQGGIVWPQTGPVRSVVVEEQQLPLPDNSVDHFLAVHCLEVSENARLLLREIWRVLKPQGRLLIVVPNRRGVWARLDTTPFGHGRPYSSGQLERLLGEAMFTPLDWSTALYLPPVDSRIVLRSAMTLERIGKRVSPAFAGVNVVEARKELIAPYGRAVAAPRLGALVPQRGAAKSVEVDPAVNAPSRKTAARREEGSR